MSGHFTWVLIWFGVSVVLAHQTAKDAKRRGHGGGGWAVIVLLTGLLGVAFYLLSRNDRVLPPEERPPRTSVGGRLFFYLLVAFGGAFLSIFVGMAVADAIFPPPTGAESCFSASCEANQNTAILFIILGFFLTPYLVYRRWGRRRRPPAPQPPD